MGEGRVDSLHEKNKPLFDYGNSSDGEMRS